MQVTLYLSYQISVFLAINQCAILFPFQVSDLAFLAVFTTEFLLDLYLDPINYWKDGYKRFDFVVLIIAYLPYIIQRRDSKLYKIAGLLKGFQVLRVLKLIYYSPGMTVSIILLHVKSYYR